MDYSSFGLKDKVVISTGASQGIGCAIALGLAQAGANLVLVKHQVGRSENESSHVVTLELVHWLLEGCAAPNVVGLARLRTP